MLSRVVRTFLLFHCHFVQGLQKAVTKKQTRVNSLDKKITLINFILNQNNNPDPKCNSPDYYI